MNLNDIIRIFRDHQIAGNVDDDDHLIDRCNRNGIDCTADIVWDDDLYGYLSFDDILLYLNHICG